VEVHTDEGLAGLGEAPPTLGADLGAAILGTVGESLWGENPLHVNRVWSGKIPAPCAKKPGNFAAAGFTAFYTKVGLDPTGRRGRHIGKEPPHPGRASAWTPTKSGPLPRLSG